MRDDGDMNPPVPGPVFDVFAVLNGVVDLRSYPRRNLVLSSPQTGGFENVYYTMAFMRRT